MKRSHPDQGPPAERRGERGAALITTLLLSTLLLLAGGALIVKSSGAVSTAYDASTEMQAYYAAEAGLQAALNVMRGNVQNGAADKATFRNAVLLGDARLGAWLGYVNNVVPVGSYSYSIAVDDPDDTDLAPAEAEPDRLDLVSTGFGPRGSRRVLRMRIRNSGLIEVPGAVTLRGRTGGAGTMTLDLGSSSGREFLTDPADPKPVFVVTNAADGGTVTTEMGDDIKNNDTNKATYGNPPLGDTSAGTAELPDFMSSPEATQKFFEEDLKGADESNDDIYIYEGDHTHTGAGSGILVVTGKLTLHGSFSWNGVIFVLGTGSVEWKGGGSVNEGNVTGGMFIVNYNPNDLAAGFGNPSFIVSGGGKSTLSYNRAAAENALKQLGFRVVGVQEQ